MSVPVEFDVTIDDVAGESDWLPLNRWGSALMRLTATIVAGTPTFSIIGTQVNVLRDGTTVTAADEIPVNGFDTITTDNNNVQDVIFRALKLRVDSGVGTVRLRIQSEGEI